MRLNKKGFVASATMYSLLVLFIALIVGLLVLFANRKMILDKLKDDIKSEINMADVYSYYDSKVVYYDPVTEKFCGNYDEENSKDGVKTGCLKWYLYDGSKASKSVKLILDHNTTLKTSKENVESELKKLSSQYGWHISAKAITAEEIAKATKKSQFNSSNSSSWYYFDNNAQTEPNNRKVFNYTGNVQSYSITMNGIYKLQAWGGSGSGSARGGYTSGLIELDKNDRLYTYVGPKANTTGNITVFNSGTGSSGGYNGGGSTDFRLVDGEWNSFDSLKSRIMVAGAGGSASTGTAGSGGGLNGYAGGGTQGGTQTTFGAVQASGYTVSSFGVANGGCTGGNGYYPGGGATCANGAGGGSSYISGHVGCNSISSKSTSSSITHTGSEYHYSNRVFVNTEMVDGNGYEWVNGTKGTLVNMPTVDGTSTMVGNTNNGASAITRISKTAWLYDNTYNCDNYGCLYKDNETNGYWTGTGTWAVSNTGKISMIDSNSTDYGVRPAIEISKLDYGEYEEEAEYSYKGKPQQFIAPKTGKYKIELWGAQGGSYSSSVVGGKGSYTTGEIELKENEIIYLYVGGQPSVASTANYSSGGWNGGGNSGYNATTNFSRGGGGATDVRLINGEWNNSKGLNSRIMVAAGGGGSVQDGTTYLLSGAAGGTLSGNNGVSSYNSTTPTGGTQTSYGTGKHTEADRIAGFGYGGGKQTPGTNTGWGGGGGSGYYGGALGHGFPGASGSSYISGHQGCVAIKSETNSGAKKGCSNGTTDTSCSYHYSGKKFNETNMIAGNASMPTYDGESVMTGNSGNGHAKVTLIETKDVNVEKFYYKSKAQTFTAPKDGTYKIELWGASGGSGAFNTTPQTELGGAGAYTSGNITLKKGEKLYVYVGGEGKSATAASNHTRFAGGYNGGGNGLSGGSDDQAGSGGGATDVRLIGGAWDNEKGLRSRIMVAAGGGGGHCHKRDNYGNNREFFPLINGQKLSYSGTLGQWEGGTFSVSASQTSGYAFGEGGAHTNLEATHGAGGGGGGYYGGKANTNNSGGPGGGGISYISGYTGCVAVTSEDSTTPKSGCDDGTTDISCSYHYSGKKFTNPVMLSGSEGMPTHTGKSSMTGNDGNGFAKITYIENEDSNVQDFYYRGSEQTFIASQTGKYKLEVWGAQGGSIPNEHTGGYGGYSQGTVTLNQGDIIYINVGGKGGSQASYASSAAGGYNGGGTGGKGSASSYASVYSGSGGGGATSISLSSGLLKNLGSSTQNILIVAGGGGGGAASPINGGYGGGYIGGNGGNSTTYPQYHGSGGTQSAGGKDQSGESGIVAGSFGQGSNFSGTYGGSGGGGGFYGGGGTNRNHSGGGGGSGYIGNSRLTEKHMACYNCPTTTVENTKTISVSSYSSEPESNKVKVGHGFARITYLGTN